MRGPCSNGCMGAAGDEACPRGHPLALDPAILNLGPRPRPDNREVAGPVAYPAALPPASLTWRVAHHLGAGGGHFAAALYRLRLQKRWR